MQLSLFKCSFNNSFYSVLLSKNKNVTPYYSSLCGVSTIITTFELNYNKRVVRCINIVYFHPLTYELTVPDTMTHIQSDYSFALCICNRFHFSFIPLQMWSLLKKLENRLILHFINQTEANSLQAPQCVCAPVENPFINVNLSL